MYSHSPCVSYCDSTRLEHLGHITISSHLSLCKPTPVMANSSWTLKLSGFIWCVLNASFSITLWHLFVSLCHYKCVTWLYAVIAVTFWCVNIEMKIKNNPWKKITRVGELRLFTLLKKRLGFPLLLGWDQKTWRATY